MSWVAASAVAEAARRCPESQSSFEADFESYLAEVRDLADEVDRKSLPVGVSLHELVTEAELAASSMTPEQSDALCQFFSSHPSVRQAPAGLTLSIRLLPDSLDTPAARGGGVDARVPTVGGVAQAQLCLTQDQRATVDLTNKAADLAGIVAQAICDAAPSGDIVVVNAVLCPIAGVLKGVAKVAEFVTKVDDVCKLFEQVFKLDEMEDKNEQRFADLNVRIDTLEQDIESLAREVSVSALSAQVSNIETDLADLNLDLDATRDELDAQGSDRRGFQDLSLRVEIERLLGSNQNDRITLFQLPAAFGGRLEEVREVVAESILMNQDAGQDIGQALDFFGQGDAFFNAQQYSDAFAAYRDAYREAAQAGLKIGKGTER